MRFLSATDLAVAVAMKAATLRVETKVSPTLGNEYVAISDDVGLIEVHLTQAGADDRLARIEEALQ